MFLFLFCFVLFFFWGGRGNVEFFCLGVEVVELEIFFEPLYELSSGGLTSLLGRFERRVVSPNNTSPK